MNQKDILNLKNLAAIKEFNIDLNNKITDDQLDSIKKLLQESADIYYNTGESTGLTDGEWDALLKLYETYRDDYRAGAPVSSSKKTVNVQNKVPELVGTTAKTNSVDDFMDWLKGRYTELGYDPRKKSDLIVSHKYDGNSVVIFINSKGEVIQAITRGKNGVGADVSPYFVGRTVNPSAKIMSLFDDKHTVLAIKCEAILYQKDFKTINESGKNFSNPRSAVAGITSSKDNLQFKDYVRLAPISMKFVPTDDTNDLMSRTELQLPLIDDLVATSQDTLKLTKFVYYIISGALSEIKDDISSLYTDTDELRESLSYMIDGLVIEFADDKIRKKLGREADKNRFDVALKFPYLTGRTKVKDIKWYVGNTQRLTPVVEFEPLIFNNAVCTNVSIASYKRFKELNLSKGDEIIIQYRNDVLSYLIPVPTFEYGSNPLPAPKVCPVCGEPVQITDSGNLLYCVNQDCSSNLVGRLVKWFSVLGIKGIKNNTLQDLVDNGFISKFSDIFNLDKDAEKIAALSGWDVKSVGNLLDSIHSLSDKPIYDYKLLGAFGIPNFNIETARAILSTHTLDELHLNFIWGDGVENFSFTKPFNDATTKKLLLETPGVGDITANRVMEFIDREKYGLIDVSLEYMDIRSYKTDFLTAKKTTDITKTGLHIVFSGFRDNDLKREVTEAGNSVTISGVSSKTDILVVKNKTKTTKKMQAALDADIPVMDIEEFKSYMKA